MKKIKIFYTSLNKRIKKAILILFCFVMCFSCDEQEFLKEVPLDFMAPENSYITLEDFDAAIYNLHYLTRNIFWRDLNVWAWWTGTDFVESYFTLEGAHDFRDRWGDAGWNSLKLWAPSYQLIYDANVIIERAESNLSQLTDDQKEHIQAEARFFRAYFYNCLAHMYGGVPLVLEEIKSPRRDFVRATRQQVYEQCAEDLKYASDNLPDIDEVDESRINKLAASHMLSEVYITLGRYQDAIGEASKVINHPRTALMTERFGSSDEKLFNDPDFEGDVYWDLFRQGNQDRYRGNTESIWVIQFSEEYGVPGGGDNNDYVLARQVTPDLSKARLLESDGTTSTVLASPNTWYNNRGQGYCKPNNYFLYQLWDEGDIRNSEHNIIRDYPVLNPNSEYNGMWVIADELPLVVTTTTDTARFFYPTIGKCITPGKDPVEVLATDQSIPGSLAFAARRTWRKHYQIRLAETYLLRAEAYLGDGKAANAAEDLNVIRRRANAPDVIPGDVDIDYILDERLRELHYEELRIMTLARLGKIVDRARRLNPVVAETIGDHQNLWAIPISEIIKNVEGNLEQNPGY